MVHIPYRKLPGVCLSNSASLAPARSAVGVALLVLRDLRLLIGRVDRLDGSANDVLEGDFVLRVHCWKDVFDEDNYAALIASFICLF